MPLDSAAPSGDQPLTLGCQQLTINVRMPDGGWVAPPAVAGERLVDALATFGLALRGAGGDRMATSNCRARIPAAWLHRLEPPSPIEMAQLGGLGSEHENSRMLDHLVMTPELDGLAVELDWDALEPQTYWTAG